MNALDHLQQGISKASLDNYRDAIQSFSQAISIDPSKIDAYYNRGLAYLKIGCYTLAVEDFSYAISPHDSGMETELPTDLQLLSYCHRGRAYHFLGCCKQALDNYNQALELDFYFAYAYQQRGLVKLDLGWRQEALEDFQTAAHLNWQQGHLYVYERLECLIQVFFSEIFQN